MGVVVGVASEVEAWGVAEDEAAVRLIASSSTVRILTVDLRLLCVDNCASQFHPVTLAVNGRLDRCDGHLCSTATVVHEMVICWDTEW